MSDRLSSPSNEPIAIIGMGCLFPRAAGLKDYWRLLRTGADGIGEIPPTHWSAADYFDADPRSPDRTYCRRGGFIDPVAFDPSEFGIPPTILEATDTSQLLGLSVARAALDDAGYGAAREFDRERFSVILGVTGTQELVIPLGARLGHPIWRRALRESGIPADVAEQVVERIAQAYVPWQENSFPGLLGNVVAGRIANRLDLRGTNCVVDAACASSLSAMHLSILELQHRRADVALTGGVDTLNDIFMYMCFSKTPALSPTGDARPFDQDADGTVLGEGIGMLVLKRLADAERDGDRVYAVIRAVGTSSDGRSQSIYAPYAQGQARCLRRAYAAAGVDPATVGLIEAHGTGTKVGDAAEFEALRTVFREAASEGRWCGIGSVKSQIGHTKAAAGAAGLIKAALALHHQVLPPTIKVRRPNEKMKLDESPFYVVKEARPWAAADHPRRAGVSSFGFGGSNFHVVLEEHVAGRAGMFLGDRPQSNRAGGGCATSAAEGGCAAEAKPAWDGSVEIAAFSADAREAVVAAVDTLRKQLVQGMSWREFASACAASRSAYRAAHQHRLVMVIERATAPASPVDGTPGLERCAEKIATALDEAAAAVRRRDCTEWTSASAYYARGEAAGSVALLYPGQGSQYVGMGRDLLCVFPEAQRAFEAADAAAKTSDGPRVADVVFPLPAWTDETRHAAQQALARTDAAQPALGAAHAAYHAVLGRFGVQAAMVAGHSFGELTALHVAERIDEATFHRLARLRGRVMADATAAADSTHGAMLAVEAPLGQIEAWLAEDRPDLVLANRNAPSQGVLSGRAEAIGLAEAACARRGWRCKRLAVSAAFHSPMMEAAFAAFERGLRGIALAPGSVPVFSNTTAEPYPADAKAARRILARQLRQPVNFAGQIEAMYAAGARVFVEVGPRAVLAGLVRLTLSDRPHAALAMDASGGARSALADLARVLAQLAALGHCVELTRWEARSRPARRSRMAIPLSGANYRTRADNRAGSAPSANLPQPLLSAGGEKSTLAPGRTPQLAQTNANAGNSDMTEYDHSPLHAAPNSAGPQPGEPAQAIVVDALRLLQEGLRAMQTLQQQTAVVHQQFIQSQANAQAAFMSMLESQQRLVERSLGWSPTTASAPISVPALPVAPAWPAPVSLPSIQPPPLVAPVATPTPMTMPSPHAATGVASPAPLFRAAPGNGHGAAADAASRRVAPASTVHEDDFAYGNEPDAVAPAAGRMSHATPPARVSDASASRAGAVSLEAALLDVVAELTGYPKDMLELDMDMEADLGIDSIKRVEILAAVQERVPSMAGINPDAMGSMRTLRQIVEYSTASDSQPVASAAGGDGNGHGRRGGNGKPAAPPPDPSPPESPPNFRVDALQRRELRVTRPDNAPVTSRKLKLAAECEIAVAAGPDDDEGGLADAMIRAFQQAGVAARRIDPEDAQSFSTVRRLAGLVLLAPRAALPEAERPSPMAGYEKVLCDALQMARCAARRLADAASAGDALFATVARMDGGFGLVGGDFDPVHGGLAGLAKTAAREWPGVTCRAIDVDAGWSDANAAAAAVVTELLHTGPVEAGLSATGRRQLTCDEAPVHPDRLHIEPGELVVISGGARGVTADAAEALCRAARPSLLLLGRSPAPDPEPAWLAALNDPAAIKRAIIEHDSSLARNETRRKPSPADVEAAFRTHMAQREIARNLDRLRTMAARVIYRAVNIRDAAAVQRIIAEATAEHGPVRALVHGAGVLEDRLIVDKTPEQFTAVYSTKVAGLHALLAAIDPAGLRHLVLFSSVSGRFGNRGQADYAMANEVLNKLAGQFARRYPACRAVAINWGPWDGGMVSAGLKREFARQGVSLIAPADGAAAMIAEMAHGGEPAAEVVLGASWPESPPTNAGAGISAAPAIVRGATGRARMARGESAAYKSPAALVTAFERVLDHQHYPFLRSHMIGGRPVFPVAMMIEWLAHAALHRNPGLQFIGVRELRVLRGIAVPEPECTLQAAAGRARRAGDAFEVDVELRVGDAPAPSARAIARLAERLPSAPRPPALDELCALPYERSASAIYDEVLFHGEMFHAIEEVLGHSPRGMAARAVAAPAPPQWMSAPPRSAWIADPLAIDAGLQLGIVWSAQHSGALSLPSHIAELEQFGAFPRDGVTVALAVRECTAHRLTADLTWMARDRSVVAAASGCDWTLDASLARAFRAAPTAAPAGAGS